MATEPIVRHIPILFCTCGHGYNAHREGGRCYGLPKEKGNRLEGDVRYCACPRFEFSHKD